MCINVYVLLELESLCLRKFVQIKGGDEGGKELCKAELELTYLIGNFEV